MLYKFILYFKLKEISYKHYNITFINYTVSITKYITSSNNVDKAYKFYLNNDMLIKKINF